MEQLQILAVRNKDYQPVVQEAHHSNSDETPLPPATPAPAISNATCMPFFSLLFSSLLFSSLLFSSLLFSSLLSFLSLVGWLVVDC